VVVDAQPEGVEGVGFLVTADGVKIRCLTIRHGSDGIQAGTRDEQTGDILTTEDNLRLSKIIVEGSNDDNVNVIGDGFQIRRAQLVSSDDNAVDVEGNGARVEQIIARGHDNSCVLIRGDDAVVEGSRFERCEDTDGIRLDDSDDARISGNTIRFSDGGISVRESAAPQVTGNTVRGAGDNSIEVDCAARCEDGLVRNNTATGASDDADGFDISSDDAGLLIQNNTALDNIQTGFDLDTDGAIIRGNTAERNGSEGQGEGGFDISGDDNLIEDNRANRNKRDGFRLSREFENGDEGSDNNVFRGNSARANSKDGFDIEAGADTDGDDQIDVPSIDNRLIKNVATNNRAEGIENNGEDTDVIRNQASGNRIDCANDGT
ncbi:MAG: right-handed parallel beta-helix repeat-containing protein, partial [Rubrobacteraceae bacterium]